MPTIIVGNTGTTRGLTTVKVRQVPVDPTAHAQEEEVGHVVTDSEAEAWVFNRAFITSEFDRFGSTEAIPIWRKSP